MNFQINEKAQNVKYFLFSQYLADGIRITLAIILPSIICAAFDKIDLGLIISEGALCISISDAPGPVQHKRNGMLYCNIFVFLLSLLTGFVNESLLLLGLLVLIASFFLTMFTVYGNRAASVGTAALLIMILRMSKVNTPSDVIMQSALILSGGIWYMLIALLLYRFTPYRPAQRSLGDCIHETAKFLRIKAALYDSETNLDEAYRKLVAQQIIVNEKQDAARELLFKNRELVKEASRAGKLLLLTFTDLVDLYEQIMATWYDYRSLRERFSSTGILDEVSAIIKDIADDLDNIGQAIQSNTSYKKRIDLLPRLEKIKIKIDDLSGSNTSNLVLKKILVNLRNLGDKVNDILNYFNDVPLNRKLRSSIDYARFVTHQKITGTELIQNFTLKSSVFRHSLRMMFTCGVGYIIGKILSYGHYSYWILLTIIIILKPGFSLTKQRNFERFTGTIAGGVIGLLILAFIHDRSILFVLIVFFMIGTYTFQRVNYIVMVIFMTPYILILFQFLGLGFVNVAEERLLDTGIGSLLAFLASYLLFPHWESNQLVNYMSNVLRANINYLFELANYLCGKELSDLEYKLVRKEVFLSTANLSAAFIRMLSEPKSKQRNRQDIYEFVVLNHVLSSNIAGLVASMPKEEKFKGHKESFQIVKRSISSLEESLLKMDQEYVPQEASVKTALVPAAEKQRDSQLLEQLDFISKLTGKINKITLLVLQ
ncbi:MAG: FUSC family membrane protein [Ginsengibacter sp.]